jgi:hypothetical protein
MHTLSPTRASDKALTFLAKFRTADRTTVVSFFGFHTVACVPRGFPRLGVPDRAIKMGVSIGAAQNVLTCGRLGLHVCLTIHWPKL